MKTNFFADLLICTDEPVCYKQERIDDRNTIIEKVKCTDDKRDVHKFPSKDTVSISQLLGEL